ncbi:adenylyl/guanylyl cyclase [Fragilaria crotonensis]|nr:adenylyl/guanylyl cyclase [Fragilaria crotonensis]
MASKPDGPQSPIDAGNRDLPALFSPGEYDVVCGKGKTCFLHPGNRRFRKLVAKFLDRYSEATTKLEKSAIVSSIIQTVRSQSPDGGFIKLDPATGMWQEVGDHLAREKVGQTIRDALHSNYKSSTKAKKERRQAEQAKADDSMTIISSSHFQISSKIEDLMAKVTTTQSDQKLSDMFTQANLEILNELNRLEQARNVHRPSHAAESAAEAMPSETRRLPGVTFDFHPQDSFARRCNSLSAEFQPSSPLHQLLSAMSTSIVPPTEMTYGQQEWEEDKKNDSGAPLW